MRRRWGLERGWGGDGARVWQQPSKRRHARPAGHAHHCRRLTACMQWLAQGPETDASPRSRPRLWRPKPPHQLPPHQLPPHQSPHPPPAGRGGEEEGGQEGREEEQEGREEEQEGEQEGQEGGGQEKQGGGWGEGRSAEEGGHRGPSCPSFVQMGQGQGLASGRALGSASKPHPSLAARHAQPTAHSGLPAERPVPTPFPAACPAAEVQQEGEGEQEEGSFFSLRWGQGSINLGSFPAASCTNRREGRWSSVRNALGFALSPHLTHQLKTRYRRRRRTRTTTKHERRAVMAAAVAHLPPQ